MHLLVLDDDELTADSIALALEREYQVALAYSYSQAISAIETLEIDGAIIDIDLKDPKYDGRDFLKVFKRRYPERPAIIQSGYREVSIVVECIKLGADDYIEKPTDRPTLQLKLMNAFSKAAKNRVFQRAFEKDQQRHELVGESSAIFSAKHQVECAGEMRILFCGETGVGKTPFAWLSNKVVNELKGQVRPFEHINCAALSSEQFQDQLFGHKKGAFTGALYDKRGLVELANGGDLFLDEIGEMPLQAQAMFLTFLDSMEYYRLGDDKKRTASVRVLSATNRDLRQLAKEGRFRKDLYSRLSQVVVSIPPLRERKEDIPHLFKYFVQKFTGGDKPCDDEVIDILKSYAWEEGNVRELRDAVEYICSVSRDSLKISKEHIGQKYKPFSGPRILHSGVDEVDPVEVMRTWGLDSYIDGQEKQALERFISGTHLPLDDVAASLKISKATLYRRLKKYGLAVPERLEEGQILNHFAHSQ